jgi:hypothetical protein
MDPTRLRPQPKMNVHKERGAAKTQLQSSGLRREAKRHAALESVSATERGVAAVHLRRLASEDGRAKSRDKSPLFEIFALPRGKIRAISIKSPAKRQSQSYGTATTR